MKRIILVITITLPHETPPEPTSSTMEKQYTVQHGRQPVCRCIIRDEEAA